MNNLTPQTDIEKKIYTIRGEQVMLDKDLAELYGVKPIRLREQVKRNAARFPQDFMFQLTEKEADLMVSQNAIPSRKHLGGYLPYVFTEQGVASLSGVLNSQSAIDMNIAILRAFVKMRRFLLENASIFQRLDRVEKRQIAHESQTNEQLEKLFSALEDKSLTPKQGVFFDGQIFDAYAFVSDLIRSAKHSIVLLDNYVDDTVLLQHSKAAKGVKTTILTKTITPQLEQDLKKHNAQYPRIEIKPFAFCHDRFLVLDEAGVYHIGASLKDLGKKWFAFSRLGAESFGLMERVKKAVGDE